MAASGSSGEISKLKGVSVVRGLGHARRRGGCMDDGTLERCTAKLREAGLWGRNLAAVSVDDAGDIARQLVDELGLCVFDELVDWLVFLIGQAHRGRGVAEEG